MPDLEAAVRAGVAAITCPKAHDASHLRAVAEVVDELEGERGLAPGSVRLVAMVEDAAAFRPMRDIAAAHPRLAAMILGAEDFAAACGMEAAPEALDLRSARRGRAARAGLGHVGRLPRPPCASARA